MRFFQSETWFFVVFGIFALTALLDLAITIFLRSKGQFFGGLFFGRSTERSTLQIIAVKVVLHGFVIYLFYDDYTFGGLSPEPLIWVYFIATAYYLITAVRHREQLTNSNPLE